MGNCTDARSVYITGVGAYAPGDPVPFDRIEDVLGHLTDAPAKIRQRIKRLRPIMKDMLGIEYCHYVIDPETGKAKDSNVSMAVEAARSAMRQSANTPQDIDLIVYAGVFYDYTCPPSSVLVQDALQIPNCADLSIHSNCTAIYKALQVASDLVANGRYQRALVVTSQISSAFLRADWFTQPAITIDQAILRWFLSDGAGALMISAEKGPMINLHITDTYLESVGIGIEPGMRMRLDTHNHTVPKILEAGGHHLFQDISHVSTLAPKIFEEGLKRMVNRTALDLNTVTCFFANIPTRHMLDNLIKGLKNDYNCPKLQFYSKLATRGYQGAPAIVHALDGYLQKNTPAPGDRLVSFVTKSSKWMQAGFILDCC